MGNGLSVATSALHAAIARAEVSGNNVANLHTPGYQPQRVVQQEALASSSSIGRSPDVRVEAGADRVDLSREAIEQISAGQDVKVAAQLVRAQDEQLGTIIDLIA